MEDVHSVAKRGDQVASDIYTAARPSYPPEVAEWLIEELGLGPVKTVVDLGAGTGKFTKLLMDIGAQVTAIEPTAPLFDQLRQECPKAQFIQYSAAAIPLETASIDLLVCAQSFHWFATADHFTEMRRIMKHGAALVLIWNVRDKNVSWVAKLNAIIDPYADQTPRYESGIWRQGLPEAVDESLQCKVFQSFHHGNFEDVVMNRVLSISFIACLPPDEKQALCQDTRGLRSRHPELANENSVHVPYTTHLYWGQNRSNHDVFD